MSDTQNQIHVKQFKDDIIQAVQQTNSRLDGTLRRKEAVKAEDFFFHKLGALNLEEKIGRNPVTPFLDPAHSRRKMSPAPFHGALFIDDFDTDRSIITGLDSDYVMALMNAAKRKKDDVIIAAATGVAFEGKDGAIQVTFPTSQDVPTPASGLTADRLLNGLEILKGNDVDPEEKLYCAISAKQERNLFDDDKIINRDFTDGAVLDKGIIGKWGNINFISSERLGLDTNGDRNVLLYTENALGFGIAKDITMKVGENTERSFTKTLYIKLDIGATRVEDEKIVRIPCTES
jgi:hypothetical protein